MSASARAIVKLGKMLVVPARCTPLMLATAAVLTRDGEATAHTVIRGKDRPVSAFEVK